MTSLKTSIKTITYLSDIGCLEIQGASLNDIHVDLCFIGTDGFSNMTGPSTPSSSDAFLDRTIISHSDKKYILGDYTKFERSSLFKICDWSEITALITNDHADKEGIAEVAKYTSVITC